MAENSTVVVVFPDKSVAVNVAFGVGVGTGDVQGPVTSTNTALARFNGTNGDALLDSGILVDGSWNMTGVNDITPAGVLTLINTGLHVADTGGGQDLIIKPGSNLTSDRTLTITTGDADRVLTMTGDASLPASTATSLTTLSLRDTSAAFDLTIGATSTTPLTAGKSLTLDVNNTDQTLKFTAASVVTFPSGTVTLAKLAANTFTADQTYAAGADLVFDSAGAGSMIGTASNQKIALWGATPVDQPAAVTDLTIPASVTGADTVDLATLNTALADIETAMNNLLARCREAGLIAT